MWRAITLSVVLATTAQAASDNMTVVARSVPDDVLVMGYYSGQSVLYPYGPMFCTTGLKCYGVRLYLPMSAPLPANEKHCRQADYLSGWFQWEPREVKTCSDCPTERVCYLEDRGVPRRLEDLDDEKVR